MLNKLTQFLRSFEGWSNCWIESYLLWRKFKKDGAQLVFIATKREYSLPKMPHAFVRFANGEEVEYIPIKAINNNDSMALGVSPFPIFKGTWRRRQQ